MTDLPAALAERLAGLLPASRWSAACDVRASRERRIAVRANTLRGTRPQALAALAAAGVAAREVQWMPDALVVTGGTMADVQAVQAAHPGLLHVQSLSSMAVAHALSPAPGARVLDACAAPGSKTSHLAALMHNQGRLVAADASRARTYKLRDLLEQLGAQAEVVVERAERWGRRAPEAFDAVLVDAPCSAEGRALAGDAAAAADWSPRKCKRLASEQKAILHSAIEACDVGGTVVYSTCTLGLEENEEVLERALTLYAGCIELEPVPVQVPGALAGAVERGGRPLNPALTLAARLAPLAAAEHPDGPWLEGFFLARLRKTRSTPR